MALLFCMDLQINYDMYGDISSASCIKNGASLPVNISYLKDGEGNIFIPTGIYLGNYLWKE